ncbi:HEAT repeat domain-containing protein [Paenibacillus sp. CAU 1782]
MSVALLRELYNETTRLYIAGSDLAGGDFRLKRLIPQLLQAGEKAPVFKKLGEGAQELAEPSGNDDRSSAVKLQELTLLLSSVLHTQGAFAPEGELKETETVPVGLSTTKSYRRLAEVRDALDTTGGGRYEIVKQAFEDGLFQDLRLVKLAINALDDPYSELADYAKNEILPAYGTTILPLLRARFNLAGGKSDARTIEVIAKLCVTDGDLAEVRSAAAEGSEVVRVAAIPYLAGREAFEADLLQWSADGKKGVREAAYAALTHSRSENAQARLYEAFAGKDAGIAASGLAGHAESPIAAKLAEDATTLLEQAVADSELFSGDSKKLTPVRERLDAYRDALYNKRGDELDAFFNKVLDSVSSLQKLGWTGYLHDAARYVSETPSLAVLEKLRKLEKVHSNFLSYAFEMSVLLLSPEEVFDHYSAYNKGVYKDTLINSMEQYLVSSSWQTVPNIWNEEQDYTYVTTILPESELESGWDDRWLLWCIERGNAVLAASLVRSSKAASGELEPEYTPEFLLDALAGSSRGRYDQFTVLWEGLRRCGSDISVMRETMMASLEKQKSLPYRLDRGQFLEMLSLPPSYRERLIALQQRAGSSAAKQLQYILDQMSEVQA